MGGREEQEEKNTDVHESTITDVLRDVLTVEYSSILTNILTVVWTAQKKNLNLLMIRKALADKQIFRFTRFTGTENLHKTFLIFTSLQFHF